MAREFYGYFDPTDSDDRVYQQDEYAAAFRAMGGTGVGSGLAVSPAGGLNVVVGYGSAMIHGYTYALIDDGGGQRAFALSTSGSADRIDRIILRLDLNDNARTIKASVKQGTPASSPVPPVLTNTALIKEISLCRVMVRAAASAVQAGDITDEREDADVCGILAHEALQRERLDERYASKDAFEILDGGAVLKADVVNGLTQIAAGKVLDARQGKTLAEMVGAKAETKSFTTTFTAAGWSPVAPHTQTVSVAGLLAADTPIVDIVVDEDPEVAIAQLESYGFVGRVSAGNGTLKAWCYEDVPEADITVQIKAVR